MKTVSKPSQKRLWLKKTPELWPIIGVLAAFFIELHHIIFTTWGSTFFNNSDTLTLPLVQQSLALKEPFNWVFSSQIFIFPEGLIYSFSALLTPNFRTAIVLNALINCLLLYGLLRLIANQLTPSVVIARLLSFAALLVFMLYSLLEPRSDDLSIATQFLMTTVYYGVILAALFSIALCIRYIKVYGDRLKSIPPAAWMLLGAMTTVALLTTLSNPLYLFQFVAPLVIVCLLGLLLNFFTWQFFTLITLPQLVGGFVAIILRQIFFKSYFSPSGTIGNYLHFSNIGVTIRLLLGLVEQTWQGPLVQKVELLMIAAGMLSGLVTLLVVIHIMTKSKKNTRLRSIFTVEFYFISGLAAFTPLSVLAGSILTGNPVPRYFLPVVVFPLLLLLLTANFIAPDRHSIIKIGDWSIKIMAGLLLIIALFSHPFSNVSSASNYYTADLQCMDRSLTQTPYKVGVAQYWRARGLQLNSHDNLKIIQVEGNLSHFTWLYNSADYQIYRPNFVVIDTIPAPYHDPDVSLNNFFTISDKTTQEYLGTPTNIYHCPSFDIYGYAQNAIAQNRLSHRIRDPALGL